MLRLAVLGLGLLWVALPDALAAEPRTVVDRHAGVRFTLEGASLSVRVGASRAATDRTRQRLYGKAIDAICSTSYQPRADSRLKQTLTWPRGQDQLTFTFPRDVPRHVKWCLLEHGARDVAYAGFAPWPGRLRVRHRFDSSGGVPVEGYLNFFRLRDGQGRVVLKRRGFRLTRLLPPGRYGLASYQRTCSGNCENLDRVGSRCWRQFRIRSGRAVRLRVVVNFSTGCRISRVP